MVILNDAVREAAGEIVQVDFVGGFGNVSGKLVGGGDNIGGGEEEMEEVEEES